MTEDEKADESVANIDADQLDDLFETDDPSEIAVDPLGSEDLIDGEITEALLKPYTIGQRIQFLIGAIAAAFVMYYLGLWVIRSFGL